MICCNHGIATSAFPKSGALAVSAFHEEPPDSLSGLCIELGNRGLCLSGSDNMERQLAARLASHKDNDIQRSSQGTEGPRQCHWRGSELDLPVHLASECMFENVVCTQDADAGSCGAKMQRRFAERHR